MQTQRILWFASDWRRFVVVIILIKYIYSKIFISIAFGPRQCGHFITTSPHSLHTHLWPHGTNACVLGRSKHIQHVPKSSFAAEEVDFFFSVMVETWDGLEGLV